MVVNVEAPCEILTLQLFNDGTLWEIKHKTLRRWHTSRNSGFRADPKSLGAPVLGRLKIINKYAAAF